MKHEISNADDIIDSRDVIARIEALTEERDDLRGTVEEAQEELKGLREGHSRSPSDDEAEAEETADTALADARAILLTWDDEYGAELKALEALQEEAEGYAPDWKYGALLIQDSYFEDYARELAKDCCDMPKEVRWPFTCIDWERAAEELQQDYTSVEFDGVEYWVQ